jgi:hypothetical protein
MRTWTWRQNIETNTHLGGDRVIDKGMAIGTDIKRR